MTKERLKMTPLIAGGKEEWGKKAVNVLPSKFGNDLLRVAFGGTL